MNSVDLEEKVCKALSLTGSKVKPENLGACHRKKKKAKVITKFKHRKKRNEVKKRGSAFTPVWSIVVYKW